MPFPRRSATPNPALAGLDICGQNLFTMPEKIEIITYSGYRSEERPVAFVMQGERIEIVEILERRIEEGLRDKERKRYFTIKGSDGATHRIYQVYNTSEWYKI